MPLVDDYSVTHTMINGKPVRCTIFKIGNTYHCVVSGDAPAGAIARSSGPTPNAALVTATEAAKRHFDYA